MVFDLLKSTLELPLDCSAVLMQESTHIETHDVKVWRGSSS